MNKINFYDRSIIALSGIFCGLFIGTYAMMIRILDLIIPDVSKSGYIIVCLLLMCGSIYFFMMALYYGD